MAELNHNVVSGDTLYGIARKYGVDVGDLRTQEGATVPEAIKPGDVVVVPDNNAPNKCGEGCDEEAQQVVNQAGKEDKLMSKKLDKANKDASTAPDEKIDHSSTCPKKGYVVVIDPGHGGKSYKDKKPGSSFNNSVSAVSSVLEKTMTQRFAKILKKSIEAAAKKAKGCSVTVYLTKTDENINISGKDRAAVAKKRKADFFIVLHFNAYDRPNLYKQHKATKRKWDQTHIMDITKGHKGTKLDKPSGYKRRLFSSKASIRGPQLVKRSPNMPKQHSLVLNSVFGKSVTKRVLAAVKKLDNSPNTKVQSDYTFKGLSVFSPGYHHKNGIVCCYLEGDYINVESADRTWNPKEYAAALKTLKPTAAPKTPPLPVKKPDPNKPAEKPAEKPPAKADPKAATAGQFYKPKKLPADGEMFKAASDAVAAAVIDAINKPKTGAKKGKAKAKTKAKTK